MTTYEQVISIWKLQDAKREYAIVKEEYLFAVYKWFLSEGNSRQRAYHLMSQIEKELEQP